MKEILKDYQLLVGSLIVASAILYSNNSVTHQLDMVEYELDTIGNEVRDVANELQYMRLNIR
ncbi:hypothetical protein M9C81_02615 [SAR86 cluster bacterium]|nr:hypothetical protein M9C81_02615 [SAR86 cluster bacterium]